MPKAAELDIDLSEPTQQPPAATAPRTVTESKRKPAPALKYKPVNFRWPEAEVKALKRAALDADMTMQDYLLSCFHAFLQARN